jgi:hypothetical protein
LQIKILTLFFIMEAQMDSELMNFEDRELLYELARCKFFLRRLRIRIEIGRRIRRNHILSAVDIKQLNQLVTTAKMIDKIDIDMIRDSTPVKILGAKHAQIRELVLERMHA